MGAILWWVEAYFVLVGVLALLAGAFALAPRGSERPFPWKAVLIFILAANVLDKCYTLFISK